jgi:probable phosphoglycerate mutase
MTSFFFIRHGDHSLLGKAMAGRMPGVHLSPEGQRQAETLVQRLEAVQFSALYASPLERTQETAKPLATDRNLEVHVTDALNEVDFGQWTGMNIDLMHQDKQWELWNSSRSCSRPPGGEMLVEVQSRVVDKVEVLREAYLDHTVALFTHSDTIRAAICFYLGVPVDMCVRIAIDPASISILRFYGNKPEIARVNDTGVISQ